MCHVNLIPLNPVAESPYQPSTDANALAVPKDSGTERDSCDGPPAPGDRYRCRLRTTAAAGGGDDEASRGACEIQAEERKFLQKPAFLSTARLTSLRTTSSPCSCCSSSTPSRSRTGSGTRRRPSRQGRSARSGQADASRRRRAPSSGRRGWCRPGRSRPRRSAIRAIRSQVQSPGGPTTVLP